MPISPDTMQRDRSAEPELERIERAPHLKVFKSQVGENIANAFYLMQSNPSVQVTLGVLSNCSALFFSFSLFVVVFWCFFFLPSCLSSLFFSLTAEYNYIFMLELILYNTPSIVAASIKLHHLKNINISNIMQFFIQLKGKSFICIVFALLHHSLPSYHKITTILCKTWLLLISVLCTTQYYNCWKW